jgi:ABC-type polysaccharide/polyol phosphate export permease
MTSERPHQASAIDGEMAVPIEVEHTAISGLEELLGGIRCWRISHLIGIRDLRHRYARSKLGQLWLMMSTAMMIAAVAVVWSLLWAQPLHELMPFIGVSLIIWSYLSQVLIDSASAFIGQNHLYLTQRMNFSVSIYSVIYKNTIIFAHNLVIIAVLIVAFKVPLNWYLIQIVPAFVLTWIGMVSVGYLIAMTCVRYRDIIQVITTWVTVLFFITPVMWKPEYLPREYHLVIQLNPLAQFLELLRNPLLGQPVSPNTWLTTLVFSLGGGFIALVLIGRYYRRIIYWM